MHIMCQLKNETAKPDPALYTALFQNITIRLLEKQQAGGGVRWLKAEQGLLLSFVTRIQFPGPT